MARKTCSRNHANRECLKEYHARSSCFETAASYHSPLQSKHYVEGLGLGIMITIICLIKLSVNIPHRPQEQHWANCHTSQTGSHQDVVVKGSRVVVVEFYILPNPTSAEKKGAPRERCSFRDLPRPHPESLPLRHPFVHRFQAWAARFLIPR